MKKLNVIQIAHYLGATIRVLNDKEWFMYYKNQTYLLTDNGGEINVSKLTSVENSVPFTANGELVDSMAIAHRLACTVQGEFDAIDWNFSEQS